MRVYVETTVWSFAFADDSPDLASETLKFFEACRRGSLGAVVSPVVIAELIQSPEPIRRQLLTLVDDIAPTVLPESSAVADLAHAFLRHGAVPPSKPLDAAHVAHAFVAGIGVLVSWNFKHIANIRRAQKFNAIALLSGWAAPLTITTPSEVTHGDDQTPQQDD